MPTRQDIPKRLLVAIGAVIHRVAPGSVAASVLGLFAVWLLSLAVGAAVWRTSGFAQSPLRVRRTTATTGPN